MSGRNAERNHGDESALAVIRKTNVEYESRKNELCRRMPRKNVWIKFK